MKVDLQARRIETGVRELIESGLATRPRGSGGSSLRAQLGLDVHDRYRSRREATLGDTFTAERAVRVSLAVDDFDATITGRMDGVIETDDAVTIEEVKSVLDHGTPDLSAARLQVAIYALALLQAGEQRPITLYVVLISAFDDEEQRVAVPLDAEQAQAQVLGLLRGVIEAANVRQHRADARARWAETMAFPHDEIREGQAMLVDAIDEALTDGKPLLAQGPTGTGKTAAALFAAVRFAARRGARVFYATPKTTQHAHVAATFEALCRASGTETDTDTDTDTDTVLAAPRAVSLHARSRLCTLGAGPCDRRSCPRLVSYAERAPPVVEALAQSHSYIGTEVLVEAAERHTLCAYELAFDLAGQADLVIGDYNYIFDPGIAMLSRDPQSTIVIVDEAHNLFDRARGYSSAIVTLRHIERAEQALLPSEPVAMITAGWLADLRRLVTDTAAAKPAPDAGSSLLVHDGSFELETLPCDFDALARSARPLLLRRLTRAPEPWSGDADEPDPVTEVLRTVIRCSEATDMVSATLVPYAIEPTTRGGPGIGIVCVDPAKALTRRHREAAGTICMSATLAPMDYWSDVLGLDALEGVQLRVPSPFSADQRRVVIESSVSTTYRDRQASLPEIGRIIAQTVALKPGPYLVFFPSFAYLTAARQHLPKLGEVLVQAPRTTLAQRRALLARFVDGTGPRVLLAVSGGVFGEGIDLPGDDLLGALIVGPSLPPLGFPRAAMARHFEATRQAGFAYAMLYPGLQRVVQAAGRVIRHEDDRGIVVLIGQRFLRPEIIECLPDDWYQYDPSELVPDDPLGALAEFWGKSSSA